MPPALEQDVKAILNHMLLKQDQWAPRVAYLHYKKYAEVADQKRSRADDAARAIRNMSGAQLPGP